MLDPCEKKSEQYSENGEIIGKKFKFCSFAPHETRTCYLLLLHVFFILMFKQEFKFAFVLLIQIGSHYHFIEVNPYMVFDRRRAYGMRLNIPAGTATRFEVVTNTHLIFMIFEIILALLATLCTLEKGIGCAK